VPVFPERFCMTKRSKDDPRLALLDEWRREPSNFNAQYLLDPVSAETAHFPRLDPAGQPYLQIEDTAPPLGDLWVTMTVDPAQSLHEWADYSAIAVGGFDARGDVWLLELWTDRRDDEGLVKRVYDLYGQFTARGGRPKSVGFEAVGFAKSYRHVFTIEGDRRGYHIPIIGLERDTSLTKQIRIGGFQGQWMGHQMHALRSCAALAEFQDQADKFRMDSKNDHDDLLDAVADLYQMRGRPHTQAGAPMDELQARQFWMQQVAVARPELDAMSLRMAWGHHQRSQERAEDETARALVGPAGEGWG
jgi:predicted phage terminase large subunit-like protein